MSPQAAVPTLEFTDREAKVLRWEAEGRTTREIGVRLDLEAPTVRLILNRATKKERFVLRSLLADLNERVQLLESLERLRSVGHLAGEVAEEARALKKELEDFA